jgi:hypothetical protein
MYMERHIKRQLNLHNLVPEMPLALHQNLISAIICWYRQLINISDNGKGKGKAVPLQAWSGPKGSRKLRYPDYMTTAQDGGKVVRLTHRQPLPPGNAPGTHFC